MFTFEPDAELQDLHNRGACLYNLANPVAVPMELAQAYRALVGYNTMPNDYEADNHECVKSATACERLLDGLPVCKWSLPHPTRKQLKRREERAQRNEESRQQYLVLYDGYAQPLPEMYGHEYDTDEEPDKFSQPPASPSPCPTRSPSPDLFCYEQMVGDEIDSKMADSQVVFVRESPPPPRAKSPDLVDLLRTPPPPYSEHDPIMISDDESGVAVTIQALHEEKETARRAVRACHISVNLAEKRLSVEKEAVRMTVKYLGQLRADMAERKERHERAKAAALAYEDGLEDNRGLAKLEAVQACLEATQSKQPFLPVSPEDTPPRKRARLVRLSAAAIGTFDF